ncbi:MULTISPECIES: PAAR domain-containing protein [Pseudomonas]|uniref:PAAR domain-containing protein n=1 Tax=Pseudomonas TaxID=286 RepID=UPI000CFED4DF|nr:MULTISPECIES: PAAR domain-containing protein [Pseudomonas]PRA46502.1 hypothetical protein CQZ98_23600 [Pseudomonas sp. MYb115]QXN52424.1 PAAR domain-containing protein [Pseudomonas fluorescens]WSO26761.1 PAAR domain-containing protein [Pseudomonas fluorescens]
MSEGFFIGLGDKTSCGGEVLDGDPRINLYGLLHACEGDRVTCGINGKTYRIVGGISHMESHGRLMAGTLDSRSNCPCKATLTPSVYTARYVKQPSAAQPMRRTTEATPTSAPRPTPQPSSFTLSSQPAAAPISGFAGAEPGFYIVPKSTTREALEATLFPTRDPVVMRKFQALNPHRGEVKAGSMIVLSDPRNFQCTKEEALLMQASAQAWEALAPLSTDEADFMASHRNEIAAILTLGSDAIGIRGSMLTSHLNNVKTILSDIESLHQRSFQVDGHLRSATFFAERKELLGKLNLHLDGMIRKNIGFPDHPNLRSALGISSRSLVHQWTQAGGAGQIPGYSTHIDGVAKASKIVKYGGWVGTAIGGGASVLKVQEVCSAGNAEACEKVKFTETGSFLGGLGGNAAAGAALTGTTTAFICAGLGVPTVGIATLVCGIVTVGVGSYVGGKAIGKAGERIGELIYENVK